VSGATGNLLLDAATAAGEDVLTGARRTPLILGMPVFERFGEIEKAVFPTSGVISQTTPMEDGTEIEMVTIGREGFALPATFLGIERMGEDRAFVQVEGEALIHGAADFVRAVEASPRFRALVRGYIQAFIEQSGMSTACNARHDVVHRCARWLLQTHDRVDTDVTPLTQEFLAQMLGVQRPTVTIAARTLQSAGLIEYQRGKITVLDRHGLEEASCECYEKIRSAYSRLVPLGPTS
jgi:CRP-like cAMP-binding protein